MEAICNRNKTESKFYIRMHVQVVPPTWGCNWHADELVREVTDSLGQFSSGLAESSFYQRKATVLVLKHPEKNKGGQKTCDSSRWPGGFSTSHLVTHHFCVWNHSVLEECAFVLLGSLVGLQILIHDLQGCCMCNKLSGDQAPVNPSNTLWAEAWCPSS